MIDIIGGLKDAIATLEQANKVFAATTSPLSGVIANLKQIEKLLHDSPPAVMPMSRDDIRKTLMSCGYNIKEGQTDLKPYVYDAYDMLHMAWAARLHSANAAVQAWMVTAHAFDQKLRNMPKYEMVAYRGNYDGYGYQFYDNGSGSDWKESYGFHEPVYVKV